MSFFMSSGVTESLSSVCDAGRSHNPSMRRSLISAFCTVHLPRIASTE